MVLATIKRRYICLVYDAFLLLAVLFVTAFLPLAIGLVATGAQPALASGPAQWLMNVYWLVVAGFYLTWFWGAGGQTLAMKTWFIRLVDADGGPVSRAQAWKRYAVAVLTFGFCFLWALWDRDHQFLHDRLAGTRLIMAR